MARGYWDRPNRAEVPSMLNIKKRKYQRKHNKKLTSAEKNMQQDELFGNHEPAEVPPEADGEDVKKTLFKFGPGVLMMAGINEQAARRCIGGWLKQGFDAQTILSAIRETSDANPAEPVAYARSLMLAKGEGLDAI